MQWLTWYFPQQVCAVCEPDYCTTGEGNCCDDAVSNFTERRTSFAEGEGGKEGSRGGGGELESYLCSSKHLTNSRNIDAKYQMDTFNDVLYT